MKPQPWLAPLTPVYSAIVRTKNEAYQRGILSSKILRSPVVSVGNLSTGGGGKTPLVIALAKLLTGSGLAVDVLSRGYGRLGESTERVDPDGSAEQYGDEPLLISRSANVPVFVGRSRLAAGQLAEESQSLVHLLDDGFQHRQLKRDLDIVVLHRSDLDAKLLPAGHLREPLSSLQRANVVVLREEDSDLASSIARYRHSGADIWHIRRTLRCDLPAGPAVAFCGIARPEEFFAGLRASGVEIAASVAFGDHHRYSHADLYALGEKCRSVNAGTLITTEKDAARLGSIALGKLAQTIPVTVTRLDTVLLEPELVLAAVHRVLTQRTKRTQPGP